MEYNKELDAKHEKILNDIKKILRMSPRKAIY